LDQCVCAVEGLPGRRRTIAERAGVAPSGLFSPWLGLVLARRDRRRVAQLRGPASSDRLEATARSGLLQQAVQQRAPGDLGAFNTVAGLRGPGPFGPFPSRGPGGGACSSTAWLVCHQRFRGIELCLG